MGRQKELYGIYESIQKHRVKGKDSGENFVLISGEAGVGKTVLMGQLRTPAGGREPHGILVPSCPSESDLYLKPWNDILSQVQEFCMKQRKELKASEYFANKDVTDYRIFATQ